MAVMTVPGQARHVGHNGVTGLGQAIEQGGLAYVRPADQYQGGFHE